MKNPLSFVSKYFAGPGQLPAVALPKPPNKAQAVPSYKTQVAKATSAVPKVDEGLTNKDLTTIRNGANTPAVMRQAVGSSPDLSATLNAYLRVGIPETFTVIGRDMDGVINVEATKLAQELLRRLTYLGDPSLGYNPTTDLQSLSESLGKELLTYGSMALELALDKTRQPLYFNPVSTTKL